ncbi:predicted protein [Naegleria gruberi]|uniref:Predicted protein n=1 Tax=Naegleria gruberi TaxID=5762 RepID=D2UZB7_NAEGR|nr:uncharacterized protein NAEGRDRAFT_61880 [Naegleria gruberi]EFC50121.1 predicted protein [Naegleria gruberi]|eukprot:XP_002682865.1 predicted protein [Naegleria gruberi strain NEG-M]
MLENPVQKLKRKLGDFYRVNPHLKNVEKPLDKTQSSSDEEMVLNNNNKAHSTTTSNNNSSTNNSKLNNINNNNNNNNTKLNKSDSKLNDNNKNNKEVNNSKGGKLFKKENIKTEIISDSSSSSDSPSSSSHKNVEKKVEKPKKIAGKLFKKSFSSSDEDMHSSSTDSDDSASKVKSKTKELVSHIHQSNDESITFKTTQVSKAQVESLLKNIKNDLKEAKTNSSQQVYLVNSLMRDEKLAFQRNIDVNLLTLENDWFDFKPLFPFFFIPKYNNYDYLVSQLGLFRLVDNTQNITYNLNLNGLLVNFNNLLESNTFKYYGTYREQRPISVLDSITIFVKITFLEIDFKTIAFELVPYHTIHVKNNRVSDNSGKLLPTQISTSFSRSIHSNLFKQHLNSNTSYGIKVSFHLKSDHISEVHKGSLGLSWEDDGELSLIMNNC